jgi:exodeoxyribonuclease V gamma subunit
VLHLASAARLEPLAAALADVLATPPDDPFTPDWVAVPSAGMGRWLRLDLARRLGAQAPGTDGDVLGDVAGTGPGDGIAANIATPFPSALVEAVVDAELAETGLAFDPWRIEHLVWAVLHVLDEHRTDPRLRALAHLPDGATRFGQARRLADLFDRYAVHRPEVLLAWSRGHDRDATGGELPAAVAWQPHLWRLVRQHLGLASLPERLPELLRRTRDGDLQPELPDRLAVFGITTLPGGPAFLELAQALARHRQVHLLLLDPSPGATARVRARAVATPPGPMRRPRADDTTVTAVHHPLTASWAHPRREATVLLADAGLPVPDAAPADGDGSTAIPPPATTILSRLQADIRADVAPAGELRPALDDRSVQVHSCHGPGRQLEVVRDAVLHLLAGDPTLREDDVVVVCPDLTRFAPLVEAAFGPPVDAQARAGERAGPPALRWRITDRSRRASSPLLDALAAVLDLLGGRFAASDVLDLCALAPIRRRFGFDDPDLARLAEWTDDVHLRWGLDPAHRARWGLPPTFEASSWQAGLDQLLTGVAVADDTPTFGPGGVVARGVEGSDVAVLGALADLVARLARLSDQASRPRPAAGWVALLSDVVDELLDPGPHASSDDRWQRLRLRQLLGDVAERARTPRGPSQVHLTLADVRRLLADQLQGTPSRAAYFDGSLTVTSLQSLRWIPHRVVCVVGLDDVGGGGGTASGDDLIAAHPLVGDRDARAEARQALLEAVLAAGEHLIVTRTGHDVRTNQPVPAAVPLAELRDAIAATVHPDHRAEVLDRLEVTHGRHGFDERELVPGRLGSAGPWSFDPGALAGARARAHRSPTRAQPPLTGAPLEAQPLEVVTLAELQSFLTHPVRSFYRDRLGASVPTLDDAPTDDLTTALSALDAWRLGDDLLRVRRSGHDEARWLAIEAARGTVPPGVLGAGSLRDARREVATVIAAAAQHGLPLDADERHPIDIAGLAGAGSAGGTAGAGGVRVVGTVVGCTGGPTPGPVRVHYRRTGPKLELALWLDLLALTLSDPSVPWRALGLARGPSGGRGKPSKPPVLTDLVVVGDTPAERAEAARDGLGVVVDLYRRGRRQPIPLFAGTSPAVFRDESASSQWQSNGFPREDADPYHLLAFGGPTTHELLDLPALPDDPSGPADGRVLRYAAHLWEAVGRTVVRRGDDEADDLDDGGGR